MMNGCRGCHAVHGLSVESEWLNLLVSHCFSMIMMPYGGSRGAAGESRTPESIRSLKSEPHQQLLEHKGIVDP